MMDYLLNTEFEQNPSNRSGVSEGHTCTYTHTDIHDIPEPHFHIKGSPTLVRISGWIYFFTSPTLSRIDSKGF
jgi:hypothetical protein